MHRPQTCSLHVCLWPVGLYLKWKADKMGYFFLLKIITHQVPFQVPRLNQLMIFGSFAQNVCSQGKLVSIRAERNNDSGEGPQRTL
jgi:hypothetical protein